jgi:hypothetical protein
MAATMDAGVARRLGNWGRMGPRYLELMHFLEQDKLSASRIHPAFPFSDGSFPDFLSWELSSLLVQH